MPLANIQDLYENAILLIKTDDLKNNDPNVKIYRFASPFVIGDGIAYALLTVKESLDKNSKKIYSLELTEIKKLSAKGGTLEYHTDSIDKLQQKHEKVQQFLENNQEKIPMCAHGKCHESIAIQCIAHAYCTYLIFCFAVLTDKHNSHFSFFHHPSHEVLWMTGHTKRKRNASYRNEMACHGVMK
jgi:hypothetical protein